MSHDHDRRPVLFAFFAGDDLQMGTWTASGHSTSASMRLEIGRKGAAPSVTLESGTAPEIGWNPVSGELTPVLKATTLAAVPRGRTVFKFSILGPGGSVDPGPVGEFEKTVLFA